MVASILLYFASCLSLERCQKVLGQTTGAAIAVVAGEDVVTFSDGLAKLGRNLFELQLNI